MAEGKIDWRAHFDAMMGRSCAAEEETSDLAVFWVYRDTQNRWCLRQEGGEIEKAFSTRQEATDLARAAAHRRGAYKLFIELSDGRMLCELCNIGGR